MRVSSTIELWSDDYRSRCQDLRSVGALVAKWLCYGHLLPTLTDLLQLCRIRGTQPSEIVFLERKRSSAVFEKTCTVHALTQVWAGMLRLMLFAILHEDDALSVGLVDGKTRTSQSFKTSTNLENRGTFACNIRALLRTLPGGLSSVNRGCDL